MQYSIYKDADVNDTIKKIQNILKDIGIEIEEIIHSYPIQDNRMPYSITLNIFGQRHGSNGKGTTLLNAKASAYSEFLERLQNNYEKTFRWGFNKFVFAPDENFIDFQDDKFFLNYYDKDTVNYISKIEKMFYKFDKYITVPFYNVSKKNISNIGITFLLFLQGSNGMCAGNTPEEALVQGLSEVCERYAMRKIIYDNITMPDIPENIWKQYDRIVEMKDYLKKYGYDVYFKDASLGMNLPVVCTLFENKELEFWGFQLGAQPSLPIAIERSLTEFMQGGIPSFDKAKTQNSKNGIIEKDVLFEAGKDNDTLIKKSQDELLYKTFFINDPCFKFSKNTWIKDKKVYTNKQLLEFMLKNISILKNNEIFIRDVSYLKHPAYYIYIPGITELNLNYFNNQYDIGIYNFYKWNDYTKDLHKEHSSVDSLILALKFKLDYTDLYLKEDNICPLSSVYLLLLCYLLKRDEDNIIKYGEILLNQETKEVYYDRCKFIYEYFICKKRYPNSDIYTKLEEKYSTEYIKNFEKFLSDFKFENIKNIIKESNRKYISKKQQEKRMEELKNTNFNYSDSNIDDFNNKINQVKNNLAEKYIQNTPNQMKLKNVFDFI